MFRAAVRHLEQAVMDLFKEFGLTARDVTRVIAHQANARILEQLRRRLGLSWDVMYSVIERYGNTSSAFSRSPWIRPCGRSRWPRVTWSYSGPSAEGSPGRGWSGGDPGGGWVVRTGGHKRDTVAIERGTPVTAMPARGLKKPSGAPVSAVSSSPVVMPKVLYVPREQVRKPCATAW